ncbi:MAG TPA: GntR family transcriptional regulator [Anaerolineae bacterium]|nr:GntR family transcriptional regulator [Anaerolineae bacterium]
MKIDRSDSTPLYKQLRLILQDHILMGNWVPGILLPTEQEICEEYEVSRITVRKALEGLVHKGMIERVQGKGSIVKDRRLNRSEQQVYGFHEITRRQGSKPSVRLLNKQIIHGDFALNRLLKLPEKADQLFWRFRRLCFVDEQPTILMNSFVRKKLGDKMLNYDLNNESFYSLYEQITKSPIIYSENTITAVSVSPGVADLLQVEPGSAQLWFRGVSYVEGDIPIEVSYSIFRSDFYEFGALLYRPQEIDVGKIVF